MPQNVLKPFIQSDLDRLHRLLHFKHKRMWMNDYSQKPEWNFLSDLFEDIERDDFNRIISAILTLWPDKNVTEGSEHETAQKKQFIYAALKEYLKQEEAFIAAMSAFNNARFFLNNKIKNESRVVDDDVLKISSAIEAVRSNPHSRTSTPELTALLQGLEKACTCSTNTNIQALLETVKKISGHAPYSLVAACILGVLSMGLMVLSIVSVMGTLGTLSLLSGLGFAMGIQMMKLAVSLAGVTLGATSCYQVKGLFNQALPELHLQQSITGFVEDVPSLRASFA